MDYDVIFWDTIGMPYDGNTPSKQGLGGSEHQVILLAEALVKQGKKVAVLNTSAADPHIIRGVYYAQSNDSHQLTCETLIHCRYSRLVTGIKSNRVLVWCTDNYDPQTYAHLMEYTFVFVSEYQKRSWHWHKDMHVIPNMLPELVAEYKTQDQYGFVYASSDINGRLKATLDKWIQLRDAAPTGVKERLRLDIYTPGYEGSTEMIKELRENQRDWHPLGVQFHGAQPFQKVVQALQWASGLFMVNTMQETFCLVAAMAEKMGRRVLMHCKTGYGALLEVVNSGLVTTDERQFDSNFYQVLKALPEQLIWHPIDFSEGEVSKLWLELIDCSTDVGKCSQTKMNEVPAPTGVTGPIPIWGPPGSGTKPKITLNMIVKNEAHVIKRCLDSVKPFIDAWVIVDTGSTDGTQDIIRNLLKDIPGELYHCPWVHFAHNRSEAITLAEEFSKDGYLLLIDADDVYKGNLNANLLILDTYTVPIHEHQGISNQDVLKLIQGEEFKPALTYKRQQLFRVGKGFRFEGVRHEFPTRDTPGTEGHLSSLVYCRIGGGARAKDADTLKNDALVLASELKKHPHDTRTAYYLAQSWKDAQDFHRARRMYENRAAMHPHGYDDEAYLSLLQCGRISKGIGDISPVKYWMDAFNILPERAEAQYELALWYRELKQWNLAALWAEKGTGLAIPIHRFQVETAIYQWMNKYELAVAYTWINRVATAKRLFLEIADLATGDYKANIVTSIAHCDERIAKLK